MNELTFFLARNAVPIFFFVIFVIIYYYIQLVRGNRVLRRSNSRYRLERDAAHSTRSRSLLMILAALLIGAGALYSRQITPKDVLLPPVPTARPFETPTPELEQSPDALELAEISQPLGLETLPTTTPIIAPTATLQNPAVLESLGIGILPTVPPSFAIEPLKISCSDTVSIIEPESGEMVSGRFTVLGKATSEDFSYYDIQMTGPSTNWQWKSVLQSVRYEPVEQGVLGNIDLSEWQTGVYEMQLVVLNTGNQEVGRCFIQVGVQNIGAGTPEAPVTESGDDSQDSSGTIAPEATVVEPVEGVQDIDAITPEAPVEEQPIE